MRPRKEYGDKNPIGRTVVKLREGRMSQKDLLAQLQLRGIDMGQTSLSRLEGQERTVDAVELRALADIFGVPIEELYNKDDPATR